MNIMNSVTSLNKTSSEFVWSQKYRPKSIDECILPDHIKKQIKDNISKGEIPHFLFSGTSGIGKTTVARAICNELDADMLFINASSDNGIDVLRTTLTQFASTMSLTGSRKVIILDESDYLNQNSVQPALRGFLDEFSKNVSFIFTCNYKNRIIDPLQGRLTTVDFKFSKEERSALALKMFQRVCAILEEEQVKYDKKAVAAVITKYFPNFRKTLNELQRYATIGGGNIDAGILVNFEESVFNDLIGHLKAKDFGKCRQWIANNTPDSVQFFRKFYDEVYTQVKPASIPHLILHIAEYQYRAAFVADAEINLAAFLLEFIRDCEFA